MVIIINLFVLIVSVIIHEIMHGYAALFCGDDTAKKSGRLSLNPVKHIDPFGSILLPLMLIVINSPFLFGWAKPVPIRTDKMRNPKNDIAYVSIAGPLSNVCLLLLGLLFLKMFSVWIGPDLYHTYMSQSSQVRANLIKDFDSMLILGGLEVSLQLVLTNVVLIVFNLIPIPPLDGSRIIIPFLGRKQEKIYFELEKYGILIIFFMMYFNVFDPLFRLVMSFIIKTIWFI